MKHNKNSNNHTNNIPNLDIIDLDFVNLSDAEKENEYDYEQEYNEDYDPNLDEEEGNSYQELTCHQEGQLSRDPGVCMDFLWLWLWLL